MRDRATEAGPLAACPRTRQQQTSRRRPSDGWKRRNLQPQAEAALPQRHSADAAGGSGGRARGRGFPYAAGERELDPALCVESFAR